MLSIHDLENRFVRRAVETLPGWAEAVALADKAQAVLDEPTAVPEVPDSLDPFTTGKVDGKWIDAQLARKAELARLDQRRNLLVSLRHEAQSRAESIVVTQLDDVLASLHGDLLKLLDEARTHVEQLGGATTATEAIANDSGAAWKALDTLALDYAVLRAGQGALMQGTALDYAVSARPAQGGEDPASDLYLANLDDVWPSWRNPGTGGERVIHVDGRPHRYEPWPDGGGAEMLVWMITSGAEPWIPTRPQLDELQAERRRRRNPSPKPSDQPGPLLNEPTRQYRRARRVEAALR